MHETGHRYRLKYNSFVIVLFVRRITFLIITLVSSNCSFTSITINRTNGMQFHDPSTETTTDTYMIKTVYT